MAGLPWIKVWTVVGRHPKVQRLERELGVKDGLGIVVRLWCWTADFAPAGEFTDADAIDAAKVARGEATRRPVVDVLSALESVGLLDRIPNGYRVHDWDEMQTRHVEAEEKRRAQGAERQARYRERHGNASRNASRNGDVTVTSVTREEEEKREKKKVTVLAAAAVLPVRTAAAAKKTILGPKGALFVRACEKGLGHGLARLTSSEDADALEAAVAAHGGPQAARDFVAATCRARGEDFDPQSVKLLLSMLRDPPSARHA
jgi:hypothetical protein